ncbi:TPA: restriction endonuclease subunit S [Vibrio parahaemolyticus]
MKSDKPLFPESWQSKIAADCFLQISTTHKKVKTKDCNETGAYPVIDQGQASVAGYIDDPSKVIEVESPLCIFGDHTRAVKWVDSSFVPGADGTKVLQPLTFLFPRFAYQQLRNMDIPDKGYSRHFKYFKELWFGIPPMAEQKVISEKLDTLLAQVEATKARLESTLETLKQFRQSVLAAAVSGKLTEDWRKKEKVNEDWENIAFQELILKVRSGSADKPTDDVSGVPILRSSAVRPLSVDYSDVRYLNAEDNLKDENYLLNGDLLFTRLSGSAEYVGNCALVRGIDKSYQYPDRLFCARLKDPNCAEYIEYFCNSDGFRQFILSSIKSSAGHQRITLDVIKKARILLPSPSEQKEIVIRIGQLFAGADATEQQVNQALERVNNLTQSILAKAFRGELTEQWRKENPELVSGENSAEALLKKIKSERANAKLKRKARTTSA